MPGIESDASAGKPELGDIYQWRPIAAPPGLPVPIVKILSDALMAAAHQPQAASWAKTDRTTLYPLDYKAVPAMIKAQELLVKKWSYLLI